MTPKVPAILSETSPASSVGPGWRSQGTNIGTDAVVKPDPIATARSWRAARSRSPVAADRSDWETHAQRSGLDPDAIVKGWAYLIGPAESILAELDRILAETAILPIGGLPPTLSTWAGYSVPLAPEKRQVQPRDGDREYERPEDMAPAPRKKIKLVVRYEDIYAGQPKTTQAPQDGNEVGQAYATNGVQPAFPFATQSAYRVWNAARHLILLHPEAGPPEILRMSFEAVRVPITDITPEDMILLQMAIEWLQNGPARTNIRTGGTPGGPFRSTGFKGAP